MGNRKDDASALRGRLVGLALSGCLVASAAPALAAPTVGVQRPGEAPLAFANPKTSSLVGVRDGSGCLLTVSGEVPAGAATVGASLTKIDPVTCSATATAGAVTSVKSTPADAPAMTGTTTPGAIPSLESAAALLHRNGDLKAWAEDVVGLDVNNVYAKVSYDYNGTRNWNALGSGCAGTWWWLSNTGWFKKAGDFFCQYENNYTRVHSSTYGLYQNNSFCATFNVTNGYARANLWGNGNGSLNYTVGWQVNTGNCPLPINGAYVTVTTS